MNKEKAIRIEITRTWRNGLWKIRIGDIVGSTTTSNITKEEVLSEIKDKMDEIRTKKPLKN